MSDQSTEQREAAFRAFAEREMPWLLEAPEDDAARLLRTTAKIAFARGLQADNSSAAAASRSSVRQVLQPHLVNQICGLRRHQVEDAVELLLNYIDTAADEAAQAKSAT